MAKLPIPCVILCGGKSTRMKEDKSKLKISFVGTNPSLAQYMYEKLSYVFDEVYLSYKNDKSYDFSHLAIVENSVIYSPLVAIFEAFNHLAKSGHKSVFIIAVDFVNINKNVAKKLYYAHQNGATIAKTKHHQNYLCGIYDINTIGVLDDMIKNNLHKVGMFFEKINGKKTRYFKNEKRFLNLNYPKDFQNYIKEKK